MASLYPGCLCRGAPDLLVALHACGGLSDAVIASAVHHRASFLVCCCCFSKHPTLREKTLTPLLLRRAPAAADGRVCFLCAPQMPKGTEDGGPCPHRAPMSVLRAEAPLELPPSLGAPAPAEEAGQAAGGAPRPRSVDDEQLQTLFRYLIIFCISQRGILWSP